MSEMVSLRDYVEKFLEGRKDPVFLPLSPRQISAILTFVDFVEQEEEEQECVE